MNIFGLSMVKKAIDHVIYSNWVVSFSAGMLTYGNCMFFKISNALWYALFAFCSTWLVYNLQRIYKAQKNESNQWLNWVKNNSRWIYIISSVMFLGCGVTFFLFRGMNLNSLLICAISLIISLLYVVKIKGISLREIPFLKIHWVAQSWVLILILFPWINENFFPKFGIHFLIAVYLYIFAVTIPFDIRDLEYDKKNQKTLPILLGIQKSKILGIVLLGISLVLFIVCFPAIEIELLVLAFAPQFFLILQSDVLKNDFYFAGWIDGCIALLGLAFLA